MLARVIGTGSPRARTLARRLRLPPRQPLGTDGQPSGKPLVAVDSSGAASPSSVFYVKDARAALVPAAECRPTPPSSASSTTGTWLTAAPCRSRAWSETWWRRGRTRRARARTDAGTAPTPDGKAKGAVVLAIDAVHAGIGDACCGADVKAAMQILGRGLAASTPPSWGWWTRWISADVDESRIEKLLKEVLGQRDAPGPRKSLRARSRVAALEAAVSAMLGGARVRPPDRRRRPPRIPACSCSGRCGNRRCVMEPTSLRPEPRLPRAGH